VLTGVALADEALGDVGASDVGATDGAAVVLHAESATLSAQTKRQTIGVRRFPVHADLIEPILPGVQRGQPRRPPLIGRPRSPESARYFDTIARRVRTLIAGAGFFGNPSDSPGDTCAAAQLFTCDARDRHNRPIA
jgi:hypothetical protein